MKRETISGRIHPAVKEQMKCIRSMMNHEGWGGVIEEMAKMIWGHQLTWLTPGKYERDTKEKEVEWKGSKDE